MFNLPSSITLPCDGNSKLLLASKYSELVASQYILNNSAPYVSLGAHFPPKLITSLAFPKMPPAVLYHPICLGSYVSFDANTSFFHLSTYTVLG